MGRGEEKEKAEVKEYEVKKRQKEEMKERRSSKQTSVGGKNEREKNSKKQKHKAFFLQIQIANTIAYAPVVM